MIELLTRAFSPWVKHVDKLSLRADAIAGILGALLVLPQGFAFASLAGLPPEYGLYTAIVPCMIAALFGSSWHVVSGPTNANRRWPQAEPALSPPSAGRAPGSARHVVRRRGRRSCDASASP